MFCGEYTGVHMGDTQDMQEKGKNKLCTQHHTGDMKCKTKKKKVKEFTSQLFNLHKIFLCLKEAQTEF